MKHWLPWGKAGHAQLFSVGGRFCAFQPQQPFRNHDPFGTVAQHVFASDNLRQHALSAVWVDVQDLHLRTENAWQS